MKLKHLIPSAVAATALLAGAAWAQESATTPAPATPDTAPAASAAPSDAAAPAAGTPADSSAAAPASAPAPAAADSATANATPAGATASSLTLTNGPVPDTPENRAKYRPLSSAGRHSAAKGD